MEEKRPQLFFTDSVLMGGIVVAMLETYLSWKALSQSIVDWDWLDLIPMGFGLVLGVSGVFRGKFIRDRFLCGWLFLIAATWIVRVALHASEVVLATRWITFGLWICATVFQILFLLWGRA
jgi:hypothetical protein